MAIQDAVNFQFGFSTYGFHSFFFVNLYGIVAVLANPFSESGFPDQESFEIIFKP